MFCINCRHENNENNNYCENCGNKLEINNKSQNQPNLNNNTNNSIDINTDSNDNSKALSKITVFFPIAFIYFILISLGIYFICGENSQQVSWVFALIIAPPLALALAYVTVTALSDNENKKNDNIKNIESTNHYENISTESNKFDNNDITQIKSEKQKTNPFIKIIIVLILMPVFTLVIYFILCFIFSIIQNFFYNSFIDNISFKIICLSPVLGTIFALAAVTDVPEEEKEKKDTNQN